MIERLLKSWTRFPLIVERDFPLIVDSGTNLGVSTRRIGVLPSQRSMLAQQAHGNFQAEIPILVRSERRSGWPLLVAHSTTTACPSSPYPDAAVSPRFKDKFHDSREIPRCSTDWKDSTFGAARIRFQGKPTQFHGSWLCSFQPHSLRLEGVHSPRQLICPEQFGMACRSFTARLLRKEWVFRRSGRDYHLLASITRSSDPCATDLG